MIIDNNFNQYLKKIKNFFQSELLIANFYQKNNFSKLFLKYKIKNYNLFEKINFEKNSFLLNIYVDVVFKENFFLLISEFEKKLLDFFKMNIGLKIDQINLYIVNLTE